MLTHTTNCREFNEKIDEERRAYEERWPNYCRECGGGGVLCESYDPSPAGVSLSAGSMEFCDPCSGDEGTFYNRHVKRHLYRPPSRPCVEQGYCPRCAAPALIEHKGYDNDACSNCGWRREKSQTAPPPGECVCPEEFFEPPEPW